MAIALLAKAVANQTSATFLRVVGSELIQKFVLFFLLMLSLFQISKISKKKGIWEMGQSL